MKWDILLIGLAIGAAYEFGKRRKRPKFHVLEPDIGEWISIELEDLNRTIREHGDIELIIVTNGKKVKTIYDFDFNQEGKPVYSKYRPEDGLITHWRPMPVAPKVVKRK